MHSSRLLLDFSFYLAVSRGSVLFQTLSLRFERDYVSIG